MPDKIAMRLGAIILAGGRSTRMGRPKESLPFGGDSLLGTLATTLASCCEPVVVVARDAAQPLPPLPAGIARTHDGEPGAGPLAGLLAGLQWLQHHAGFGAADAAFAIGCDHPWLTAEAVRWLASRLDGHAAVMPRVDDFLQPLCAVYRSSTAPTFTSLLAAGNAGPRDLAAIAGIRIVEAAELRTLDPDLRFLRNVNTPADYAAALRSRDGTHEGAAPGATRTSDR